MIFTITQAGLLAAASAGSGGPLINITTFKVGSAVGYTPSLSDTNLRGTVLHTGVPISYNVISANLVNYTLRMDETVGDFTFGEVGLFLADGTLFALASLTSGQQKLKSSGPQVGSVINVIANLNLTNATALLQFTINSLANAKILEIGSTDLLTAPVVAASNAYIVHSNDDVGNPLLAIRESNYKWRFHTHNTVKVFGTVTAGPTNTVSMTSTDIFTHVSTVVAGKYILQFTSGVLAGICRNIASSTPNTVGWATSTVAVPQVGDTFEIYQSDASIIQSVLSVASSAESILDDALTNAIIFGA